MKKYNPVNERIKYKYFELKREAKGLAPPTIDGIAKALARFEQHTEFDEFRHFNKDQAKKFKLALCCEVAVVGGQTLSKSTIYSTLRALEAFFLWLAQQPGFRARINPDDAEYFTYLKKDARIATTRRERSFPSMDEIRHMVIAMPTNSEIERRNQAIVAFLVLVGARVGAVASLRLGDVDVERRYVFQDARHVKTKNSKSISSFFFPVGDEIHEIVVRWIAYLRVERGFTDAHPLFPRTSVEQGSDRLFRSIGVGKTHWKGGGAICKIVAGAATAAGVERFTPHALRTTLSIFALGSDPSIEEMKACSQNLGHEHLDTTLRSYSPISVARQGELIRQLATKDLRRDNGSATSAAEELARMLRNAGLQVVSAKTG